MVIDHTGGLIYGKITILYQNIILNLKILSVKRKVKYVMRYYIKKIISVCMLVILVSAMMTGCFPTTENKPNSNSSFSENSSSEVNNQNDASKFPTYIEDTDIEKLTIKANVNIPADFDINQKVSIASAKPLNWDKETIVSGISNGRQVVDEFSGENTGPNDLFYSYTFDDDSNLTFYLGLGSVSYYTEMETEYQYAYYFDNYENFKYEDTLKKMFSDENIDGIEKSNAVNNANQVISLLEIDDILGEPQIYSMDAASVNFLQDEYDARDKYGNKVNKWSDEQEAYLLIYPVLYQNIPSLCMNANGENELISSSKVYFVYGKKGLITFNVSGIFDVKCTVQDSYTYSPLDAIQSVKDSFENLIMDTEIEISLIKLAYITRYDFDNITEWQIEPVWFIEGKYVNAASDSVDGKDNLVDQNYTKIISAVNGETVPLVSIGG